MNQQTIPNPQQPIFNPMLAGMVAPAPEKESKTIDYRINFVAKDGTVTSGGIVKFWKRHEKTYLARFIEILSSPEQVLEITRMDEAPSESKTLEF